MNAAAPKIYWVPHNTAKQRFGVRQPCCRLSHRPARLYIWRGSINRALKSMPSPPQLVALARKAAASQSLDPALVCAVIEQESSWNPWAMRYEPAFFAKYVAHLFTNNKITASEAYARGFSWGLMQIMGQVAREMGFDGMFLSALCDPEQGLAIGCKLLRKKIDAMNGDTTRGLLAWNGGGNPAYPAQVLARRAHYL